MTRGWRKERVVQTTDTAGAPVEITTGLTQSPHGETVVGIAIGTGPSAILRINGHVSTGPKLIANLRGSLADLHRGGV
ncbi:MAG: hypothetical protein ACRDNK_11775 [Solirubrobacteraceae bacterium]